MPQPKYNTRDTGPFVGPPEEDPRMPYDISPSEFTNYKDYADAENYFDEVQTELGDRVNPDHMLKEHFMDMPEYKQGYSRNAKINFLGNSLEGIEKHHKLPQGFLKALALAESDLDPKAKSNAGAEGMFQLTNIAQEEVKNLARRAKVLNPDTFDPYEYEGAADGAARYLQHIVNTKKRLVPEKWDKLSDEDKLKLLAFSYNAGPTAIRNDLRADVDFEKSYSNKSEPRKHFNRLKDAMKELNSKEPKYNLSPKEVIDALEKRKPKDTPTETPMKKTSAFKYWLPLLATTAVGGALLASKGGKKDPEAARKLFAPNRGLHNINTRKQQLLEAEKAWETPAPAPKQPQVGGDTGKAPDVVERRLPANSKVASAQGRGRGFVADTFLTQDYNRVKGYEPTPQKEIYDMSKEEYAGLNFDPDVLAKIEEAERLGLQQQKYDAINEQLYRDSLSNEDVYKDIRARLDLENNRTNVALTRKTSQAVYNNKSRNISLGGDMNIMHKIATLHELATTSKSPAIRKEASKGLGTLAKLLLGTGIVGGTGALAASQLAPKAYDEARGNVGRGIENVGDRLGASWDALTGSPKPEVPKGPSVSERDAVNQMRHTISMTPEERAWDRATHENLVKLRSPEAQAAPPEDMAGLVAAAKEILDSGAMSLGQLREHFAGDKEMSKALKALMMERAGGAPAVPPVAPELSGWDKMKSGTKEFFENSERIKQGKKDKMRARVEAGEPVNKRWDNFWKNAENYKEMRDARIADKRTASELGINPEDLDEYINAALADPWPKINDSKVTPSSFYEKKYEKTSADYIDAELEKARKDPNYKPFQ